MTTLMKRLLLLLMLVSFGYTHAQQQVSKVNMMEDIDDLYLHLHELHPNMHFHTPQQEYTKAFNDVKKSLPDSLSVLDFYYRVGPLVALIGEGHTFMQPPQNEFIKLNPHVIGNYIYIFGPSKELIFIDEKHGRCLIKSINEIPSHEIVDKMFSYISGEGRVWKGVIVNKFFDEIFYSIVDSTHFDIEFLSERERRMVTKTIAGIRYREKRNIPDNWEVLNDDRGDKENNNQGDKEKTQKKGTSFSFKKLNDETLYFRMTEFGGMYGEEKKFIDSMFVYAKEQNISNLIIDICNNFGGEIYIGDHLMRYIAPKPFRFFNAIYFRGSDLAKKYKLYPENAPEGLFHENMPFNKPIDNEYAFRGEVYLLNNYDCYSMAVVFSNTFKEYKAGTIVGQETGGHIFTHGNTKEYKLPNSQLNYKVATCVMYGPDGEIQMKPVYPDVESGNRNGLEIALKLIEEKKARSKKQPVP